MKTLSLEQARIPLHLFVYDIILINDIIWPFKVVTIRKL